MTEEIDHAGRWILVHAVCRFCGRPSWDDFPEGVVAERYRCPHCGHAQNEARIEDDARAVTA